jgi:hypothetical protein
MIMHGTSEYGGETMERRVVRGSRKILPRLAILSGIKVS